jgi:hypothetical protein
MTFFDVMDKPAVEIAGITAVIKAKMIYNV